MRVVEEEEEESTMRVVEDDEQMKNGFYRYAYDAVQVRPWGARRKKSNSGDWLSVARLRHSNNVGGESGAWPANG